MANVGTLYGVGTGPGDPELLTLKAVAALEASDVVAHFAKRGNISNARRIVQDRLRADVTELPLHYPVTTELDRHSEAYSRQIEDFFDRSAETVAVHLSAGRTVSVLSEGDPLFYGSYMHLHVRLVDDFPTVVIPGITAMSGCWSIAGRPIAQGDDVLTILPGTLDEATLSRRLAETEAAVVIKVGRNLAKIRRALGIAGKVEQTIYVERGTMAESRILPLTDLNDDASPYFSLLLVPGWSAKR